MLNRASADQSLPDVSSRTLFVWTKMQAEGGQSLASILEIKEAERQAGDGVFWWGVGNSLGSAVRKAATDSGGTLPVLFSQMRSPPKKADTHPSGVCIWNTWKGPDGKEHEIPNHVLEWSRGTLDKKSHYALVCHSDQPLRLDHHAFEPSLCRTHLGNPLGGSQVTALLEGDLDADHAPGSYHFGFRATLVAPWMVMLVKPRLLSDDERATHSIWRKDGDWRHFINRFRGYG